MPIIHRRENFIKEAQLEYLSDNNGVSEKVLLRIRFSIDGSIRRTFSQASWEKAYNQHDNSFRLKIGVVLKSDKRIITSQQFVRKAVMFWTRNPKIPFRIWVFIVQDDAPLYPLSVQEAQSLMFDVDKAIEVSGNQLKSLLSSEIYAEVRVSWGRHAYTEPVELEARISSTI